MEVKNKVYNTWPKRFMRCVRTPMFIDGIPIRSMECQVDVLIPFSTGHTIRQIIFENAAILSGMYNDSVSKYIPKFDYYFLFGINENGDMLGIGDDGLCVGQLGEQIIRVNPITNEIVEYQDLLKL